MTIDEKTTCILYNPKCSKCRQTLQLLNDKGIEPDVIEYLNNVPDFSTIEQILDMLGIEPRDLMRTHEAPYKDLDLGRSELGRSELIQAMIDNPILIERPVVIQNGKAVIGRPPEKILDIIQ
ncbi:MAG: arsenate reductase (glutaredoxin) [Gammaproteobacteria bacterium]|nr:arsenate reductase (glutaredoxin) [Gammaproteobacteria bacterium]